MTWFMDRTAGAWLGFISKNNYILVDPTNRVLHQSFPVSVIILGCTSPTALDAKDYPEYSMMNGAAGVVQHAGSSCMYAEVAQVSNNTGR